MKRNKMRFKFIIPMILAVITIAGIIAMGIKSSDIYAADPTYTDSGVTYTLSKTTLKITGTGKVTNVWKNRSELGSSLTTTITSVSIAKTITGIEASAFEDCTALTKVTFATGSTCTSIGNKAFKGCTALTNTYNGTTGGSLPASITTIGNEAFSGCIALNSFGVGTGLTSIGRDAFKDAKLTGTLTYNAINCATYNSAFAGKQFATVKVGSKVEVIPENFIRGNEKVKIIIIPASVEEIKTDAFNGCLLTQGLIIKNKDCKIETASTISKNTTVFVKIPANKDYRSFAGVMSNGTTFSSLLNWLYENDKAYVPYTSKPRDTKNMSEVSQSVDNRGSKTNGFISTLGDYGYKVGTEGGPSGTKRKWLFGNVYGNDRIFG